MLISTTMKLNVYAEDNISIPYFIINTPNAVIQEAEQCFEKQFSTMNMQRTTGDYYNELVKIGSIITPYSDYKLAFNQPAAGTIFPTKGSGFIWGDSTQSAGVFSLSLSIGGTIASVSLNYQPGTVTGNGVMVAIKDSQIGKPVKLYCARKYSVTRYAVYQVNKYTGQKSFLRYEHVSTVSQRAFQIYNV